MSSVSKQEQSNVHEGSTYLGNVCSYDRDFSKNIENEVKPPRQECSASLGQIESTDSAQFDSKTLQEYGKEVRQQNNKEQLEAIRRAGSDICRVVSGINWQVTCKSQSHNEVSTEETHYKRQQS